MSYVEATYQTENVPQLHRGNPLITALPPIWDDKTLLGLLNEEPGVDIRLSKQAPAYIRQYDVEALSSLYLPPPASLLYGRNIDLLVRKSYVKRNPTNPAHVRQLYDTREMMRAQGSVKNTLAGIVTLKGGSGQGKSRLTNMLLSTYPQVIHHSKFPNLTEEFLQVVWLSVEAPIGGAMKAFMVSLFEALDTALGYEGTSKSYAEKIRKSDSYPDLITQFVRVAKTRWLGLLHIDDIQRIAETKTDKEHVMQIMIRLANVAQFGIVFSGTEDIAEVIAPALGGRKKRDEAMMEEMLPKEFEITRRMVSEGFTEIERPKSHKDVFFQAFIRRLLQYQWLDEPLVVSDELYEKLYRLTAGVPAVIVLLYKKAQMHALALNAPGLELKHFVAVYRRQCRPLWPLVNGLIRGRMSDTEFNRSFDVVFDSVAKS
jgi:hypothetical protein